MRAFIFFSVALLLGSLQLEAQRIDPNATYMIISTHPGDWDGASLSWDGPAASGTSHPMASVEFNDPVEWRFQPVAGKENTFMIISTHPGEWDGASLSWDGPAASGRPHPMASVEYNDPVEWQLVPVRGKKGHFMIISTHPGEWEGASLSWDGPAAMGTPHPRASVEFNDPVEWKLVKVEK
jgi:hypothetical protein